MRRREGKEWRDYEASVMVFFFFLEMEFDLASMHLDLIWLFSII